ncbi:MAG: hypothetical protein A2W00_15065 [Candidatus Eisenbacteria bacterium RBG_16_71_46]|nr:MAG: hypothetical protein A2W00_15065 [Candidatus Eisenbacteria bacterium RBG_16_71_46]
MIAVCAVGREGYNYIYVQRVNSAGVPQWSTDGAELCSSHYGGTSDPVIVADVAGGAIVAWFDIRDPDAHAIYAQRVDADGNALWTNGGVRLCDQAQFWDGYPVMVADGAGGAIVAWADRRLGGNDIFAQRVDANGNALWTYNGVEVGSYYPGWQESPVVGSDGSQGAIICWMDGRNLGYSVLYAQRLDAFGAKLWGGSGTPVCAIAPGHQQSPEMSRFSGGDVCIAWEDRRSGGGDIYAQRMDLGGNRLWGDGGVAVCASSGDQGSPDIVGDLAQGAVITWRDFRSDVSGDIYAQRVRSDGVPLWTPDGVALCGAAGRQYRPAIAPDVGGGGIVTWEDERAGNRETRVYAQSVNPAGVPRWSADGVPICPAPTFGQNQPAIVRDGNQGGAFIVWYESRSVYAESYGQRVDSLGVALWPGDGVGLYLDPGVQRQAQSIADGSGNTIVVWAEKQLGDYDIYARKFDAAGFAQWPKVPVCTVPGLQAVPGLVSDGAGGAIVSWTDARRMPDARIYAQRLDAAGARLWPDTGVVVCAASGMQIFSQMVSDGQGGAIVCWSDGRGTDMDIYAQRVDATGATQWAADGIPVCSAPGEQPESWNRSFSLVPDGAGGAFVAWSDGRWGTDNDVYVQHLTPAGVDPAWPLDGGAVCNAAGDQLDVTATADGAGGVVIVWQDGRGPSSTQLYAQRVDPFGWARWLPDGTPVETSVGGGGWLPRVISDGTGGAIVSWTSGGDIYAQRLSGAGGTRRWPDGGVIVCNAGGAQSLPAMVPDGAGGAIVVWHDWRAGGALASLDLYAQRLNSSGSLLWGANGAVLCSAPEEQLYPACTADGAGGVIAFWEDRRDHVADYLHGQRLNAAGAPQWPDLPVTAVVDLLVSTLVEPDLVRVSWELDARSGVVASVYRRGEGEDWSVVATAIVDASRAIRHEDRAVTPGSRYGYRLGIREAGAERFVGEVWVEVPARAVLSLAGARPNPVRRDFTVSLSLPSAAPATLDVLDVGGRVRVSRSLTGLGAGSHTLRLDEAGSLAPGVYFIRLLQQGRSVVTKACVVH